MQPDGGVGRGDVGLPIARLPRGTRRGAGVSGDSRGEERGGGVREPVRGVDAAGVRRAGEVEGGGRRVSNADVFGVSVFAGRSQ